EKKKGGNKEEKRKVVDVLESHSMLENDHDEGEGFDNESPRSKVVESLWQDPDVNDSGLTEGSETEEDVGFHSDEEDIGINGQPISEDSLHLRTSGGKDISSPKQKMFFSLCSSYRDILHCNKRPCYLKGLEDTSIMDAYIMHSLNHVFRTRDCEKNDAKLTKLKENADSDRFRDQCFTRPKVLILLPLASIVYRVVKRLVQLTPSAYMVNVEHMDRFSTKFGSEEHKGDIENGKESENAKPHKSSKVADFQILFGGNNEDDFMIGIKFTRKTVKLFSDFHTSDIIIALALCLVNKIEEAGSNKEKDVDFLSSLEVLIIDHADVTSMQNWYHVHTVIEHLNRLPSKQPGTDVMRIRPWYTTQSDISRARVWFYEGKRKILVYTERSHFYHRYKIRGVQNLIIYSLPERKEFYPEIVNMLDGSDNMTCTALFSYLDKLRLERIVGTTPAKRMVVAEKGVFVFCH
ncbi:U3 small nucleolar RNA-associated protein 25, partial [Glycine soja]